MTALKQEQHTSHTIKKTLKNDALVQNFALMTHFLKFCDMLLNFFFFLSKLNIIHNVYKKKSIKNLIKEELIILKCHDTTISKTGQNVNNYKFIIAKH